MSVAAVSHYHATALWLRQCTDIHAGCPAPKCVAPVLEVLEALPRRSKRRKSLPQHDERSPGLLDLPEELTLAIVELVDAADLAFLSMTCRTLRLGMKLEPKWRRLYEAKFNGAASDQSATALQQRAAALAGSWQELYKCRLLKDREVQAAAAPGETPWEQPCKYELQVALERLVATAPADSGGCAAFVMFLLDGSGSVTEDDFRTMTEFIGTALDSITESHPAMRVGILQFSNEVRVEMPPKPLDKDAFQSKLQTMTRMNGGTNISLAISKAGQLLQSAHAELLAQQAEHATAPERSSQVLVLLTDGRVDAYQAHEARSMMEGLLNGQTKVSLHAFGVGRGVDKVELLHIIAACGTGDPEDRYLGLRVLDEHPW